MQPAIELKRKEQVLKLSQSLIQKETRGKIPVTFCFKFFICLIALQQANQIKSFKVLKEIELRLEIKETTHFQVEIRIENCYLHEVDYKSIKLTIMMSKPRRRREQEVTSRRKAIFI